MDDLDNELIGYIRELMPIKDEKLSDYQKLCYDLKIPVIRLETARFITVLLQIRKPENVLEIGTASGFSASVIEKCLSDTGRIVTIEKSPALADRAAEYFRELGISKRIEIIRQDALGAVKGLDAGSFDVIFLDAAKGQYINLFQDCLRLLKVGGLLIADDVFQRGDIWKEISDIERRQRTVHRRLREFLEAATTNPSLESCILPLGDGLLLSIKTAEVANEG